MREVPMSEQSFLTSGEAAELLGVSGSRIRELISKGRLQATPVGRMLLIDRADAIAISKAPKIAAGRPSHQLKRPSRRLIYRQLRKCFIACNLWHDGSVVGCKQAIRAIRKASKAQNTATLFGRRIAQIATYIEEGKVYRAIEILRTLGIDCFHCNSSLLIDIKIKIEELIFCFKSDPFSSPLLEYMATSLRVSVGNLNDLLGVFRSSEWPLRANQLSRETVENLHCLSQRCGFLPVKSMLPYERALEAFNQAGIERHRSWMSAHHRHDTTRRLLGAALGCSPRPLAGLSTGASGCCVKS
jgi:excisionase family DNA binding protein